MRSFRIPSALLTVLAIAACVSVDEERQQMNATITAAGNLASEIISWRSSFPGDIPATVVESIESFQRRAEAMHETLDDLSDEATAGADLSGVKQALKALEDFDTSRLESASPTDRASLLDQFRGLATNLQTAVNRARRR